MTQILNLLTYNIQVAMESHNARHYLLHSWHHLLPHPRRAKNLDMIAEIIKPFDVVALQELDVGSIRSRYVNQAEFLANKASFPYVEYHTTRSLGPFARHSKALLSQYPIHNVNHYELPSKIPGRGITTFCLGQASCPVLIVNVHLSLGKKARNTQLEYIAGVIAEYAHVIVMGDFNLSPHELATSPLAKTGLQIVGEEIIFTYPSWRPKKQIDYILLSSSLKLADSGVLNCPNSDHLPLFANVVLPDTVVL